MNAAEILNRFVVSVTPGMHKVRRESLTACVDSAVRGSPLCVTGVGRHLRNRAHEKHRIKRVDRLCSNGALAQDMTVIYGQLAKSLVAGLPRPIIHIDWSDMDDRQESFLLRASLAAQGRALTLYEELHPLCAKEKPRVHRAFLSTLKRLLPETALPIIVTDAGFRSPWFRLVRRLGWDYVGRVRNRTCCQAEGQEDWWPIKSLYGSATHRAKALGLYWLGKSSPFKTRFVLLRKRAKGRKDKTAAGDRRRRSAQSRRHAAREREPWLLATSLEDETMSPHKIAKIYATRMQIEESFRDLKSGLGMKACRTRGRGRLAVLLLIATLAHTLLYRLGLAAKEAGRHWTYQSTSVKSRTILSNLSIGLCACRDQRLHLTTQHWRAALDKLRQLTLNPTAAL